MRAPWRQRCVMVSHFIRTVVPLCTPHIRADTVVEIDMGTQVITHSPNAVHFAAHIVAIYRYLAEVARRLLAKFPSLFCVTDCVGLFKLFSTLFCLTKLFNQIFM